LIVLERYEEGAWEVQRYGTVAEMPVAGHRRHTYSGR
jgi:hypothetical protein